MVSCVTKVPTIDGSSDLFRFAELSQPDGNSHSKRVPEYRKDALKVAEKKSEICQHKKSVSPDSRSSLRISSQTLKLPNLFELS